MNYIRELNAFRNLTMISPLATGEVALWHSLMSVNNQATWREWFSVPNSTLQTLTGLSRQGLDKARNRLVQRELIAYNKGSSNKAGNYKMLSVCQIVGTAVDTVVVTAVGTAVGTVGASEWAQQEHISTKVLDLKSTATVTSANATTTEQVPILTERDRNEIEAVSVSLLRRHILGSDEIKMIQDLVATGVTKDTIIQGIRESFAAYKPRTSRDSINRLTYCQNHILDLHEKSVYQPQAVDIGAFSSRSLPPPGPVSPSGNSHIDPELANLYPSFDPYLDMREAATSDKLSRNAITRNRSGPISRSVGG